MGAATILGALFQVVMLFGLGWIASGFLLKTVFKGRVPSDIGLPERTLLAIVGFVMLSVVLMIVHIVTGGAVFGIAIVVPLIAVGVVLFGRRSVSRPVGISWAMLGTAIALLIVLYVAPAIVGESSVRTGDPPWHLGWTEQLLAGDPVPTGPAPEYGRNAYPWGWHAVLATLVRLVPGTTPLVAHEALHLLIVLAIPLAAACIARRIDRGAGWWAAGAVSLIGGFGWLLARTPDFVTSPAEARYGADLVVASPNSLYELFPPALPREFALVVLGAAAMFISWAVATRDRRLLLASGAVVGAVGLISVPLFFSALVWLIAAAVWARLGVRQTLTATGVALLVFALWAGPTISDSVRFGGFVNITPMLGKEWPLVTALGAWGLLLPLAGVGFFLAWRNRSESARAVIGFALGTAMLLTLAIARGIFDWDLAGNATLLHQGRVWPPAHLLGAALAGVAGVRMFRWLSERSKAAAGAVTAVVAAVGMASPALATQRMTEVLEAHSDGFVYSAEDVGSGSFVSRAARILGPDDIVRVMNSDELAFLLFQFSGCKLADYDDPRLEGNDLRIRFADLAGRWQERMGSRGFRPDYLVLPASDEPGQPAIASGEFEGGRWVLIKLSRRE